VIIYFIKKLFKILESGETCDILHVENNVVALAVVQVLVRFHIPLGNGRVLNPLHQLQKPAKSFVLLHFIILQQTEGHILLDIGGLVTM